MSVTIYPIFGLTRCVLKGLLSQCVLFLSKTFYALLSTGSTKELGIHSHMTEKLFTVM